ncbi:hypothetical protein GCM10022393_22960 [Aquimarina addita]|uniref:MoaD/ThiS family protein n=1 Tax=Aquimarina addita TaxID=870485 RepID=A0ABP6UMC4_9FLAO
MDIKVRYFGMIAETANCTEEILSVDKECNVDELKKILKSKYQKLQNSSFTIAIDKQIASDTNKLNSNHEIALLPPFSGG